MKDLLERLEKLRQDVQGLDNSIDASPGTRVVDFYNKEFSMASIMLWYSFAEFLRDRPGAADNMNYSVAMVLAANYLCLTDEGLEGFKEKLSEIIDNFEEPYLDAISKEASKDRA